jgi:hypothetical protein
MPQTSLLNEKIKIKRTIIKKKRMPNEEKRVEKEAFLGLKKR